MGQARSQVLPLAPSANWRQSLCDLSWLVARVSRTAPMPCALWTISSVAAGLLVPAQLWLTKTLVDSLAAQLQGVPLQQPLFWLTLLAGVVVLDRVVQGSQDWLSAELREQAGAAVREGVMRQAAGLPFAAFEEQTYYDRLSRILRDAEQRVPASVGQMLQFVRTMPHLLGYAIGLAAIAPSLLVVVLIGWMPALVLFRGGGRAHFQLLREQTREQRLAEYYEGLLFWRMSAKEVRLYQLRDYLLGQWEALFWTTHNAQRALAFREGLKQRGASLVANAVSVFGIFWVVSAGLTRATPGEYAVLFQALHGLVQSLFTLARTIKALAEHAEYAGEFRTFTALPAEQIESLTRSDPLSRQDQVSHQSHRGRQDSLSRQEALPFPCPLRDGIRFEDVWFSYPGSDRPVLSGVTLHIRAGEKVALVGENGAGKSTLVKLLLGLHHPSAGRITVDGIDLRSIEPRALRRALSAVFQQFTHYQLTLAENVAVGQPEQMGNNTRVEQAVQMAGAVDVVRALPQGYETLLGPDVGGVDLSGGQWQRVAVARAFFREAQVLVLDEPTAALDPLAELAVFERFVQLAHGKTAVLISHRLGMARLADRVLVLSQGRVVEDGPHATLMGAAGEYATLFDAQARWYV